MGSCTQSLQRLLSSTYFDDIIVSIVANVLEMESEAGVDGPQGWTVHTDLKTDV